MYFYKGSFAAFPTYCLDAERLGVQKPDPNESGSHCHSDIHKFDSSEVHYKFIPPETSIRCAFTQRPASEHKKATTPPMSSGSPTRPSAVAEATY